MSEQDGGEGSTPVQSAHFGGRELAENLPVSAILFQAKTLLDSLEVFTESDYPLQTVAIAKILKLLAGRAYEQLFELDASNTLKAGDQARARDLGSIVHVLHAYLRYLQASDPLRTPPGVQQAISLLISAHGQAVLGCGANEINVLVRPQWTYNLKYVDIVQQFERDAECDLAFALDPRRRLPIYDRVDYDAQDLIDALWKAAYPPNSEGQVASGKQRSNLPTHVAVLSFAGLDRDDILLYPLLAHELGHFLDFASDDIGKLSTDSKTAGCLPTLREVKDAGVKEEYRDDIVETIQICLREITADLLAARMVGLGYLFAFNEFFKTLGPWPGPLVNPDSGYPGFGLRLQLIYNELSCKEGGIRSIEELKNLIMVGRLPGKPILEQYVAQLQKRVESLKTAEPTNAATRLIERAVKSAIPAVQELVREIIPSSRAAKLPENLPDMVELLAERIPPFQPPTRAQRKARNFAPWSFHEILTAGWLYQMAIGEARERSLSPDGRFKEYQNTCLLLLKALELEGARAAIASIATQDGRSEPASKSALQYAATAGQGVVSGPSMCAALDRNDPYDRLVICPEFGDEA